MAPFAVKLKRSRRQRAAVAEIIQLGGIVTYNGDPTPSPETSQSRFRSVLGHDFFDDVVEVHLSGPQIQDLAVLNDLPKIELLDLAHTSVYDLSILQELEYLEVLRLDDNPQIIDLSVLTQLERLRELDLINMLVIDEHIAQLKQALPDCVVTVSRMWTEGPPAIGE